MKLKIVISILLVGAALLFYFFKIRKNAEVIIAPVNENRVSMVDGKFKLHGKDFFPITLNYLVSLQANSIEVWPTSSDSYFPNGKYQYTTKDSCLAELLAEMELIKEMGFNSVRIVGAGEVKLIEEKRLLSVKAFIGNERDTILELKDSLAYSNYFNALDELFKIAETAGLKVVFLSHVDADIPEMENHLRKVVNFFKGNTAIMAYDLFNEPLYFDPKERDKQQVHEITTKWNSIVKSIDPGQLTTIGLSGIRETLEWDPNILGVDFISFHPYEYEPEQVRNEIYWYYKNVDKPWVLGETSIPADGDSVPYENQLIFAINTLNQTRNCNGAGYSWWQYKDVDWAKFHSSFMGVVARGGTTLTGSGKTVLGTVKPVVKAFQKFDAFGSKDSCLCFSNYYNYSESKGYRLTGKVVDQSGNPVEGAVIVGWNKDWNKLNHTVSRSDGRFELKADFQFYYWKASAPYCSTEHEYKFPTKGDTLIDIGLIKLTRERFN